METSTLLDIASQNPSKTARQAGIARSTLLRIKQGKTQPSLETLQEIALSLGFSAEIKIGQASDPTVTFATRYMLDETIPEPSPDNLAGIKKWSERFERWNITEPEEMVLKAGQLSNLSIRKKARFFAPNPNSTPQETALLAASAGDAAGAGWALSGQPAANRLLGEQKKGPVILWTEQQEEAAYFLAQTLTEQPSFTPTAVVLLPAENGEFIGSRSENRLTYVADLQAVIDLHSLGFSATARAITANWS